MLHLKSAYILAMTIHVCH